MKRLNNFSKNIILFLLAFSLFLQQLFSEEIYQITETELTQLEMEIKTSKEELIQAENKLEKAEKTLEMQNQILIVQNQLLNEYEKEERLNKINFGIKLGVATFSVGFIIGGLLIVLYK